MLDVKDRKILAELLLNSRISLTALAKKTGVSREVVFYRLNRLRKDIILGFYTTLNYNALGFRRFGCYLQLKGINTKKEEELFSYLNNHPHVTYFGPVIGRWNVVFDILAKDDAHLKSIVKDIKIKCSNHLESLVILSNGIEEEMYPTKFVGIKHLMPTNKKALPLKIDETDKKILSFLSENPRIEYSKLSSRLKLSANAIKYRIKAMEKSNIITGYTASINYTKLGLQFYNIQVKESSEDARLISFLRDHKNVLVYYKNIGQENWNLDIGVIVKDGEELRHFIIELKDHFGEFIKIHDMYMVSHVIKDNIAPTGIFG